MYINLLAETSKSYAMITYLVSAIVILVCIGLCIFLCIKFDDRHRRITSIVFFAVIVSVTFSTMVKKSQYLYIDDEYIVVKKGIGRLCLPRSETTVTSINPNTLRGCKRSNGTSGPWGHIGWFNVKDYGRVYMMLPYRGRKNLVMLEHDGTKYVVLLDTTLVGVKQKY